jgi:hypothetical protein
VGKKKSKSTTTNEPPKWARPHLEGAANSISGVVNANQGNLDSIAGGIRGFLPGLGERAFGANAGLDAATGYATDVLGGKYLENNPYIDQMASLARGNTMDQINSSFSKSGRVGSALHGHDLGRGISEAELGLRYQNYGNERNAMTQAAGMMPALNQSQYAGVMPYLAAAQTAGTLPYSGIQNLGQIGGLFGGYGTQTSTQPGGWGQALGAGLAAGIPFIPGISAREAKTKIERIGEWDGRGDGLGKYRFAYKWAPEDMLEGVMADEVEKLRPKALGPIIRGYQSVNYAMLEAA